jgi:U3 small nucleolar RNA-associated protein 10
MATALTLQLKQLKPLNDRKKLSLLFDFRQAANIDLETIYEIGIEGLNELTKYDERFAPYEDSLFSKDGKELERQLQTTEVNKKLDESIGHFLRLLSPYFLLRPAHKALEYLIRRYRFASKSVINSDLHIE